MTRYVWFFFLASILFATQAVAGDELKVEANKENVVASRLEGHWQLYESLTKRLTGKETSRPSKLSFKPDPKIAGLVPAKYVKYFKEQNVTIYLSGTMKLDVMECPFVLIQLNGNPHVMFWLDLDGDRFGNGESCNVMLAVAENQANDLLFVGGDFNNQPFSAFERVKVEAPK